MKIAATYYNGQIFQHFGQSPGFKIYTVEDGKIVSSEVIDNGGNSHGTLIGYLSQAGIDALVCGGIGNGAVDKLTSMGISMYTGFSGDADAVAARIAEGKVQPSMAGMHACSHSH
ncbi:hypothetical protein TALC_00690 [Thermoplasmatales archaeon BRNA1]|nr:hypothetical protein TALC_00690 [Thermoplasmatales archaeon BRNA1]